MNSAGRYRYLVSRNRPVEVPVEVPGFHVNVTPGVVELVIVHVPLVFILHRMYADRLMFRDDACCSMSNFSSSVR